MSEKKSKTQVASTTNTKLLVATVALLAAGGLAFATVPLQQLTPGQCGLKKINVTKSCSPKKYKKASFTCVGGARYIYLDPSKVATSANCKTKQEWQAFATEVCNSLCPAPAAEVRQSITRDLRGSPASPSPTSTPTSTPGGQRFQARVPVEVVSCSPDRLPEGEYVVTQNIQIPAAGEGVYATCFRLGDNTTLRCNNGVTISGGDRTIGVSVGGTNSEVQNCTFNGITRPITVGGTQNRVTGNTIVAGGEATEYGASIYVSGEGQVISGNTIQQSLGNGIYITRSRSAGVRYNTITESARAGIRLDSETENNVLSLNTISANRGSGIYAFSALANTINENVIERNTASGIFVRSSRDIQITNNQVGNNIMEGIRVEGATSGAEPQHLMILGNVVQSNQTNGIFIGTEENTIQNNRVEGNRETGLYVLGSQNTISQNTIQANGRHGIYSYAGERNRMEGNQITSHPSAGILLSSLDTVVTQNRLSGNSTGIVLDAAQRSELRNNTISENEYGIKVLERSVDTFIVDNIIHSNSTDGIFLGLSGGEVTQQIARDAGLQLVPPLRTVIQNTQGCRNTRADLYCQIQQETTGQQNLFDILTQCAEGAPVEVDFQTCQ